MLYLFLVASICGAMRRLVTDGPSTVQTVEVRDSGVPLTTLTALGCLVENGH